VGDDRRMLRSLYRCGAVEEWEVDWGALVPQRPAQVAKRRWRLMLQCVPDRYERSFTEIVNYLIDTYAPDIKRPREEQQPAQQRAGPQPGDGPQLGSAQQPTEGQQEHSGPQQASAEQQQKQQQPQAKEKKRKKKMLD
jgi:hypothetical protein